MTPPWTEIYYRGRKIGQTPLVDVEFPPGTIKLRAVNKEAGIDRTITIRVTDIFDTDLPEENRSVQIHHLSERPS